jgi:hypothetical protein
MQMEDRILTDRSGGRCQRSSRLHPVDAQPPRRGTSVRADVIFRAHFCVGAKRAETSASQPTTPGRVPITETKAPRQAIRPFRGPSGEQGATTAGQQAGSVLGSAHFECGQRVQRLNELTQTALNHLGYTHIIVFLACEQAGSVPDVSRDGAQQRALLSRISAIFTSGGIFWMAVPCTTERSPNLMHRRALLALQSGMDEKVPPKEDTRSELPTLKSRK